MGNVTSDRNHIGGCLFASLPNDFRHITAADEYPRSRAQPLLNLSDLLCCRTDKFLLHLGKHMLSARAVDVDPGCGVSECEFSAKILGHVLSPEIDYLALRTEINSRPGIRCFTALRL